MHRILFSIGPLEIYTYGVFIALAILISVFFMEKDAKKAYIDPVKFYSVIIWIIIGGISGARALFVILNLDYFIKNMNMVLAIRSGGMAFQGGLAGGFIAGLLACKINGMPKMKIMDLASPYLALGEAIGRIGCFFNGCCYGNKTAKWGVIFPGESIQRIPVQLVSTLFLSLLFIFLIKYRKKEKPDGHLFIVYLAIYSAFRFLMEFLRDDMPAFLFNLTAAQIISVIIFITAGILAIVSKNIRDHKI